MILVRDIGVNKHHKMISEFQCECGDISTYIKTTVLNKRRTKCSSCVKLENTEKAIAKLVGTSIGEWTIESFSHKDGRSFYYNCVCSCGTKKKVLGTSIVQRKSIMCTKCSSKIKSNERSIFKNGKQATSNRLYRIWKGMKHRGRYSTTKFYEDVTVCKVWQNSFYEFEKWSLANGYDDTKEIDKDMLCDEKKISPKIYSPETCLWITRKENRLYSATRDLVVKEKIRQEVLRTWQKLSTMKEQDTQPKSF